MSDVRNAAERLRKLLRAAQYPQLPALNLEAADVHDLLRVLHFVLLDSSRAVAQLLVDKGYDLYGKTDARFVESAFRLLRNEFRCFPTLTPAQFLSHQFVARRLNLVADAAAAVAQKRQELQRQKRREEAVWSQPQSRPRRASVENHVLPAAVNHAASILQHLQVNEAQSPQRANEPQSPHRVRMQTPPPAPVRGERVQAEVADAVERATDGVQTEMPDYCERDSDGLKNAVADLSRQLGELSSALLGKMSSVESRLDRLETKIHSVQEAVDEQRKLLLESRAAERESEKSGNAEPQRGLDGGLPCAWPPQPSVFERY